MGEMTGGEGELSGGEEKALNWKECIALDNQREGHCGWS